MVRKSKNQEENEEILTEDFPEEQEEILPKKKQFLALKTVKIQCNGIFDLTAGEPVPEGISEPFLNSLLTSNLIK